MLPAHNENKGLMKMICFVLVILLRLLIADCLFVMNYCFQKKENNMAEPEPNDKGPETGMYEVFSHVPIVPVLILFGLKALQFTCILPGPVTDPLFPLFHHT